MSLFGALYTAVSGLSAQSSAFGNISDNVANSQTVGFKETDTSFIDYLTTSNAQVNDPGSVATRPDYTNDVQGTVTSSTDATALAISGNGFFAVAQANGTNTDGTTSFSSQQLYTRAGDFTVNAAGYLENSAGAYLEGWNVDSVTGAADQSSLQPIQVGSLTSSPVATSKVTLSANLPATPAASATTASQVQVYDALGNTHVLNVNWTQNSTGDWTATVTSPDNQSGTTIGTAEVKFGSASGNSVAEGTIGSVDNTTGSVTGASYTSGGEATLTATANFGSGNQAITIDLGSFGGSSGVTQFAGTTYQLNGLTQDGAAAGNFSSVNLNANGKVVVNFDNGQSRTIAQVPVAVFADANALQRQSGQAFTATAASGAAVEQAASSGQAGSLVVGSTESSNVDVATEFSKLIVAQQAYGANTKVITTASDMLTQTIDMKR